MSVKLSISLTDDDVAVVDRYAEAAGLPSRSAVIQQAIRLLADPELDAAYEQAWQEWESSGDAQGWDLTVGDGLTDVPR